MLTSAKRNKACGLILACVAFLVAACCLVQPSYAVMLTPGAATVVPGEGDPAAGAVVVGGGLPVNFVAPTYTGTLTSTVWTNDASNPFGLNALTFTYVISNSALSAHELHRLTVSSFDGFLTDVSYSTTLPAGLAPTFADRNGGIGDVIGFSYPTPIPPVLVGPGPILPGLTTMIMVIQTNAVLFQPTLASVIDGSTTMVSSFAPQHIIPEPGTLALGGMGLACAAVAVTSRRRARK